MKWGMDEGLLYAAAQMRTMGMSDQDIMKALGLSADSMAALK